MRRSPKQPFPSWWKIVTRCRRFRERMDPHDFRIYHARGLSPLQAIEENRKPITKPNL